MSESLDVVALFGDGWTGQATRVPASARLIVDRGGRVFERVAPNVALWFGARHDEGLDIGAALPRKEKP